MCEKAIPCSGHCATPAVESAATNAGRAPYVKPKLSPLCVATGTRGKATAWSAEASDYMGPS